MIPECIKCGSQTLLGGSRTATMNVQQRLPPKRQQEVTYSICHTCTSKHGALEMIRKGQDGKYLAYFSKDKLEEVVVEAHRVFN